MQTTPEFFEYALNNKKWRGVQSAANRSHETRILLKSNYLNRM